MPQHSNLSYGIYLGVREDFCKRGIEDVQPNKVAAVGGDLFQRRDAAMELAESYRDDETVLEITEIQSNGHGTIVELLKGARMSDLMKQKLSKNFPGWRRLTF